MFFSHFYYVQHIVCQLHFSSLQVGTPKTHRRYLARDKGTYGPMPRGTPKGLLGMPFNTTVKSIEMSLAVLKYLKLTEKS